MTPLNVQPNVTKCKVWGPASSQLMARLHNTPWASMSTVPWAPGTDLKVLGVPINFLGSHDFSKAVVTEAVDQLEEACSVLRSLGDPQSEHLLLRCCLDACKLVHFLRGTNCSPPEDLIQRASGIIRSTWCKTVGATREDNEWIQSTLPMRLAGMGIKDPMAILTAARVAATLTYTKRAAAIDLPDECVRLP